MTQGWKLGTVDELLESGLAYAMQSGQEEAELREQQEFEQWRRAETARLEWNKQKLRTQKTLMEQERKQLNIDKQNFQRQQEYEANRQKQEEQLLDMKRQILEEELYKLAEEKRLFEQKKRFYDRVHSYQKSGEDAARPAVTIRSEMFFVGVNNASALKKRYKDLLKIYHPDNKCGDTDTIQEINREYQRLLEKMKEKDNL